MTTDVEFEVAEGEPSVKESNEVKAWLTDIEEAEARERKWRIEGRKVIALYEAEHKCDYQFNILYSNTETLAPALYSTTPTPVVQRRFKDDDPVGLEACKVLQRTLAYFIDNGQGVYASFDDLMNSAVLSGLVPGRGVTRYKYDAEIANETPVKDPDSDIVDELAPLKLETATQASPEVTYEALCGEPVAWDRFCHGYGQTWPDVPWVAYKWPMTRPELIKNFGHEIGSAIEITSVSSKELDNEKNTPDDMMKGMKIAWVYEIWNKATKEIIFISEGYKDGPLKKVPDPLHLSGFFTCPPPLQFFNRVASLMPQTLYAFYEEQAKELNQVTFRINRITKALKVRGIYDSTIDALKNLFEADDNALLPADNVTAMYERGGLEKAVWLLPIDKLIMVLQQLYINRQQSKQVIYEITGLSDILRGTSNPNETLGAQKIKDQWGNLRLRKLQKRVQSYVVDGLRIMAEIACSRFSLETFKQITGLQYPMQAEKEAIQAALPTIQDPAAQAAAQEVLSKPSWEDIMSVLQDNIQRGYKIDIETNSTLEPEATEDKESMMGLMNALSQFLLGVQPLVQDGSLPFDAMKAILLTISRRFNFGDQVEEELKKMQAPAPKADPAMEKEKADLQKQQEDLANQQSQMEVDRYKAGLQAQYDQKVAEMQKQLEAAQADFAKAKAENDMEAEHKAFDAEMKLQQTIFDLRLEAQQHLAQIDIQNAANVADLRSKVRDGMDAVKQGHQQDRADTKAKETIDGAKAEVESSKEEKPE